MTINVHILTKLYSFIIFLNAGPIAWATISNSDLTLTQFKPTSIIISYTISNTNHGPSCSSEQQLPILIQSKLAYYVRGEVLSFSHKTSQVSFMD